MRVLQTTTSFQNPRLFQLFPVPLGPASKPHLDGHAHPVNPAPCGFRARSPNLPKPRSTRPRPFRASGIPPRLGPDSACPGVSSGAALSACPAETCICGICASDSFLRSGRASWASLRCSPSGHSTCQSICGQTVAATCPRGRLGTSATRLLSLARAASFPPYVHAHWCAYGAA